MRQRANITGEEVLPVEGELKNALEIGHGGRRGIDGKILSARAKGPQIVKAHDVVRMRVGVDDGIEAPDVFAQALECGTPARYR